MVKICGITSPEDALAAVQAGADAIGLNFYAGPRRINISRGRAIAEAVGSHVQLIGLFAVSAWAAQRVPAAFLHAVQLYEAPADMPAPAVRWWRVVYATGLQQLRNVFAECCPAGGAQPAPQLPAALLIDAHCPDAAGGTGKMVDWEMVALARQELPRALSPPLLVLAGGLTPQNVAAGIRITGCRAVDVASGVEMAGHPGKKDRQRMEDFVAAAKAAFTQQA